MTVSNLSSELATLVERLKLAAESASRVQRGMAEAKSLRQAGNKQGRTDLYMWPTPEQTLEGQAASGISSLLERNERRDRALSALLRQWDAYQESDLSQMNAHDLLVRYELWNEARAALETQDRGSSIP